MHTNPTSKPELNLTGTSCPMAFVKARVFLDQQPGGAIVIICYEDTTANEPLVRSISALGHKVLFEELDKTNSGLDATVLTTPNHPNVMSIQLKRIEIQVKK